MSSVGVNYCLYLLSQENVVVLLALLLTLSKFVDVGRCKCMEGSKTFFVCVF